MGRQSKATISRLSNLQKSKNTHIPTFNDVFDEEDTNSYDEDFPDLMSTIYSLSYQSSYTNRAARFISAYGQGLSSPEAAWANQKYHSHRTLPLDMAEKKIIKRSTTRSTSVYDFFKNLLKPFLWPNTQLFFFFFSSPYFAALGAYISDYIRWPVPDGLCLMFLVPST